MELAKRGQLRRYLESRLRLCEHELLNLNAEHPDSEDAFFVTRLQHDKESIILLVELLDEHV